MTAFSLRGGVLETTESRNNPDPHPAHFAGLLTPPSGQGSVTPGPWELFLNTTSLPSPPAFCSVVSQLCPGVHLVSLTCASADRAFRSHNSPGAERSHRHVLDLPQRIRRHCVGVKCAALQCVHHGRDYWTQYIRRVELQDRHRLNFT